MSMYSLGSLHRRLPVAFVDVGIGGSKHLQILAPGAKGTVVSLDTN